MSEPAAVLRARIFDAVVPVLEADESVHACWEGGSVAMGRADEFSDIDLYVVAAVPHHLSILDLFERALGQVVQIAHRWQVEPPPFNEVAQRIYLLRDAPRFFAVDCAVRTPAATVQFLERERHGEARFLFTRDGTLGALPLDRARHTTRLGQRLAQIRASWPVYRTIVEKELTRGRSLDAIGFYFNGLLRPLTELIGMRYRPERFDYGWRYLHDELPPEMQRQMESFAYVDGRARIRSSLPEIDRLAASLFAELGARA
jgi:predicted nucleotidyltransferase